MVGSPPLTGQSWDYAPAPESRDIATIAAEYGLFIDGEFTPAADGKQFTTVNPATEEALATVAEAGRPDVNRAIAAARQAFEQSWGPMPGRDRAKYLYRIAPAIQEQGRALPRAAPRQAFEQSWGPMPGRDRAKYLYRIARAIQERAREFAVLESLDNGKPIKESRDVDVPLAAAHFFYHAGWADKLEHAGFG